MQERSLFISSCTRRQLARRRTRRAAIPMQLVLAMVVAAIALGGFIAAHGGL